MPEAAIALQAGQEMKPTRSGKLRKMSIYRSNTAIFPDEQSLLVDSAVPTPKNPNSRIFNLSALPASLMSRPARLVE